MHSVDPEFVQANGMETPTEQINEAARWLEEHIDDNGRQSGVFILPPAVVPRSRRNYALKRLFDFFAALIAIIILSPVFIVIYILVRATSPGPAIFKQKRVGYQGKEFTFYKFRSMRQDADDALHREVVSKFMQGQEVGENGEKYKLRRDPRVTNIGAFIRGTSLDELPQLFNIIKGDMSIVGPRPPLPYEVEHYRYRHRYRLLITPGLTGIWQVYGRSRVDFETLVSMDLHYVTDSTFWLDIKLIWLTFAVVFKRSGGQ